MSAQNLDNDISQADIKTQDLDERFGGMPKAPMVRSYERDSFADRRYASRMEQWNAQRSRDIKDEELAMASREEQRKEQSEMLAESRAKRADKEFDIKQSHDALDEADAHNGLPELQKIGEDINSEDFPVKNAAVFAKYPRLLNNQNAVAISNEYKALHFEWSKNNERVASQSTRTQDRLDEMRFKSLQEREQQHEILKNSEKLEERNKARALVPLINAERKRMGITDLIESDVEPTVTTAKETLDKELAALQAKVNNKEIGWVDRKTYDADLASKKVERDVFYKKNGLITPEQQNQQDQKKSIIVGSKEHFDLYNEQQKKLGMPTITQDQYWKEVIVPEPKTSAEASKLPHGTVFRDTDGKIRTNP